MAPALAPVEPASRSAGKLNPSVLSVSPGAGRGLLFRAANAAQLVPGIASGVRGKVRPKSGPKSGSSVFSVRPRKDGVRPPRTAPLGSRVPTDEFLNRYQRQPVSRVSLMSCGFTSCDNAQI